MALRGHEIRVIDYEILWQAEGKVELFSKRQVFHASRILAGSNITVIRPQILKVPMLDYLSMLFTYRKEIKQQMNEFKPDIVLGNDILTTSLAYREAKKRRIPTIFYAIDIEYKLIPFSLLQPLGKMIEKSNIRNADLVISINEALKEYTVRMGADPTKTLVIRAGIDSQRYNPALDGSEIRKQYGIEEDDVVLFFMGWIYHFSGLKEVLSEFAKIGKENKFKFLIVGDGEAYDNLKRIVKEKALQNKVIMTGKQPFERIPSLISAADICLLPAYNNEIMRDIVPIKMYEYMAMGKPIISTKLPGVMKEFGENHGVLYVENSESTLSKAVELVEEKRTKGEGAKARKFVERNDWNEITNAFETVLEGMVKLAQN